MGNFLEKFEMNIVKSLVTIGLTLLLTGCVYTTYTTDSAGNTVKSEIIVPSAPRVYYDYSYNYPYVEELRYKYIMEIVPRKRHIRVPYKPFNKGPSPYYERYYSPRKHID